METLYSGVALHKSLQFQGQSHVFGAWNQHWWGNVHQDHQQTLQIKDWFLWLLIGKRERETLREREVCFKYFFIFVWAGSSLLCLVFPYLRRAGQSIVGVRALLTVVASLAAERWLPGHPGFSSSCAWARLLCSVWDLPSPEIGPLSPALAGGLCTTEPPQKPETGLF